MKKCIIAAVADDGAIGIGGALPWHISEDLKYFRRTTDGYPVIMGRRTYESIGRPLPGRLNIVLHGPRNRVDGAFGALSFEDAYAMAQLSGKDKCFVIGGATVYDKAMPEADRLYITHVRTVIPEADAWFPPINSQVWSLTSESEVFRDPDGLEYRFAVYDRI